LSKIVSAAVLAIVSSGVGAADPTEGPYHELPYAPSLDPTLIDHAIDPCDDLYRYSCAGWIARNPIPADQPAWSAFDRQQAAIQHFLWGLLTEASSTNEIAPERRQIGDYFAACMDTPAIEAAGFEPIREDLARIRSVADKRELAPLLGELHRRTRTDGLLFSLAVQQDPTDTTRTIPSIDAGGIALPDRDYYTSDHEHSRATRERYVEHVAKMFELIGQESTFARQQAETVLRIETALAIATLTGTQRRDPSAVTHVGTIATLNALAPAFDWATYFRLIGLANTPTLNVSEPEFVRAIGREIETRSLEDLRTYLEWALLDVSADYLSDAFVVESYAFNRAYLLGTRADRPRWRKCVAWVDRDIGEALAKEFVQRTFSADAKARAERMTHQIELALGERIRAADWMSAPTKREALRKLGTIHEKIGYPPSWRDYGALPVARNAFFANVVHAAEFEWRRLAAKVGRPFDRDEWVDTPATVDAFYDQQANDITFPAAVLLPPLFDPAMDDAPNFGNTGATIGHELTHAFDDEGRQFDADGNLHDWWTTRDAKRFEERAACLRDQFAEYVVVDDIRINSALTSGEDLADFGGLVLAWLAWREATRGSVLEPRDGLTPEQRFFVGYAQSFCANERPEWRRLNAIADVHSPPEFRVNGVVANLPEFAEAFHCPLGKGLARAPRDRCRLW
jgi:endothelin-converting enzyme/putative endopeptidase